MNAKIRGKERRARLRGSAGFSLIEVMVAALVLGLGLVGLVGLQVVSLKMNQAALSRSIASDYAYAMIDKIRSNAINRRAYVTSGLISVDSVSSGGGAAVRNELALWTRQLDQMLPNARVQICLRNDPALTYATGCGNTGEFIMVRVAWQQGKDAKMLFDDDAPDTAGTETVNSQSIEVVGQI
ncbi:MAG: type IV pilus modification protein PilV [Zoogloeaceae bacterium]|jgi:type IV pilus assembly protein PilV|nr:type IV pilus modification protein PilV [Zoogloeaceae bacterium]